MTPPPNANYRRIQAFQQNTAASANVVSVNNTPGTFRRNAAKDSAANAAASASNPPTIKSMLAGIQFP